ncbi:MAG: hypothetical protein H7249_14475 [Chitinophagaceae bacterium]|nr:hypothetical protein [Oligoflexus sp.]
MLKIAEIAAITSLLLGFALSCSSENTKGSLQQKTAAAASDGSGSGVKKRRCNLGRHTQNASPQLQTRKRLWTAL